MSQSIKLNMIILIIMTLLLVAFGLQGASRRDRCESLGGVNVEGYMVDNCWKDGGFIELSN